MDPTKRFKGGIIRAIQVKPKPQTLEYGGTARVLSGTIYIPTVLRMQLLQYIWKERDSSLHHSGYYSINLILLSPPVTMFTWNFVLLVRHCQHSSPEPFLL